MKKSNSLSTLHPLLRKPLFTSKEAEEIGVSSAVLGYYVKAGQLERLRRGVYQSCDFKKKRRYENTPWEDFLESLPFFPRGVVCLSTALAIYRMTDEAPREHWLAVPHTTSVKQEGRMKVVRFRDMELGKTKINLGEFKIPIFDRERTIVDTFRLLGPETAMKALKKGLSKKGSKRLNLRKLQEYAKKLRFDIMPYLLAVTLGNT
jgi:predicted transcriptional regulator of viral defense system